MKRNVLLALAVLAALLIGGCPGVSGPGGGRRVSVRHQIHLVSLMREHAICSGLKIS
jgi:hypothetical protein